MSWPWIDYERTSFPSEFLGSDSGSPTTSSGSSSSPTEPLPPLGGMIPDTEALSRQLAGKLVLLEQLKEDENLPPSNPRFKTEICRNFKEKGSCVYGGLCQFAHGKHELRQDVVRHTKYKTKLCQKFWIAGYCAYGPRCNFIHQEMEKRVGEELMVLPSQNSQPPPSVIRRAGSGYTRPSQNVNSTMVRNVADVLRIAKLRGVSQGDSGNESGSDYGVASPLHAWQQPSSPVDQGPRLERPILGISRHPQGSGTTKPIGSELLEKKGWLGN